jgi:hypothetical protein
MQQDRHTVMYGPREIIGDRDDQAAARNRFAGLRVFPLIPKASGRQDCAIRRAYEIGLFAALGWAPLVIAGRRHDAARAFEGRAEHRLTGRPRSVPFHPALA